MNNWLVTGGAGYIGSHVVKKLTKNGITPIVLDDFSTGFKEYISGVQVIETSLLNKTNVDKTFRENNISGVIHLAGFKYAGDSVNKPLFTYEQNIEGMRILLESVVNYRVPSFVFSSSAAVYGNPEVPLVTEKTAVNPESPYGETKLAGEWLLRSVSKTHGLNQTSLRYFNVIGAGLNNNVFLADRSPHNLLPLVFSALRGGADPKVFGNDYKTPDGTCVRDYIDVEDLAKAHVSAALSMNNGIRLENVYNLGSSLGSSVMEILDVAREVSGIGFKADLLPRRAGDPASIVADGSLAGRDLNWNNLKSLKDSVNNSWLASEKTV